MNGLIYIGQAKDLERRYNQYFGTTEQKNMSYSKLKKSFIKYGKDNHTFSVIDFCKSKEEMDFKEYYYINKVFNSKNNGLNNQKGNQRTAVSYLIKWLLCCENELIEEYSKRGIEIERFQFTHDIGYDEEDDRILFYSFNIDKYEEDCDRFEKHLEDLKNNLKD